MQAAPAPAPAFAAMRAPDPDFYVRKAAYHGAVSSGLDAHAGNFEGILSKLPLVDRAADINDILTSTAPDAVKETNLAKLIAVQNGRVNLGITEGAAIAAQVCVAAASHARHGATALTAALAAAPPAHVHAVAVQAAFTDAPIALAREFSRALLDANLRADFQSGDPSRARAVVKRVLTNSVNRFLPAADLMVARFIGNDMASGILHVAAPGVYPFTPKDAAVIKFTAGRSADPIHLIVYTDTRNEMYLVTDNAPTAVDKYEKKIKSALKKWNVVNRVVDGVKISDFVLDSDVLDAGHSIEPVLFVEGGWSHGGKGPATAPGMSERTTFKLALNSVCHLLDQGALDALHAAADMTLAGLLHSFEFNPAMVRAFAIGSVSQAAMLTGVDRFDVPEHVRANINLFIGHVAALYYTCRSVRAGPRVSTPLDDAIVEAVRLHHGANTKVPRLTHVDRGGPKSTKNIDLVVFRTKHTDERGVAGWLHSFAFKYKDSKDVIVACVPKNDGTTPSTIFASSVDNGYMYAGFDFQTALMGHLNFVVYELPNGVALGGPGGPFRSTISPVLVVQNMITEGLRLYHAEKMYRLIESVGAAQGLCVALSCGNAQFELDACGFPWDTVIDVVNKVAGRLRRLQYRGHALETATYQGVIATLREMVAADGDERARRADALRADAEADAAAAAAVATANAEAAAAKAAAEAAVAAGTADAAALRAAANALAAAAAAVGAADGHTRDGFPVFLRGLAAKTGNALDEARAARGRPPAVFTDVCVGPAAGARYACLRSAARLVAAGDELTLDNGTVLAPVSSLAAGPAQYPPNVFATGAPPVPQGVMMAPGPQADAYPQRRADLWAAGMPPFTVDTVRLVPLCHLRDCQRVGIGDNVSAQTSTGQRGSDAGAGGGPSNAGRSGTGGASGKGKGKGKGKARAAPPAPRSFGKEKQAKLDGFVLKKGD